MAIMSYSFNLWSHPGKLLKNHISYVYKNGSILYEKLKLKQEDKILIDLCLLLHDFGKASTFFQKYIRAIDRFEKKEINQDEFAQIKYDLGKCKNHSRISAVWTFIAIEQLLKDPVYSLIGFITVLRHHGNFTNLNEMLEFSRNEIEVLKKISLETDYAEIYQILKLNGYSIHDFNHSHFEHYLDDFFNSRHFRRKWKKEIQEQLTPDTFYKTSLAFSILLAADKGECIFDGIIYQRENKSLQSNLVDFYKSEKFSDAKTDELNKLRNQVYDSVNEQVSIISDDDRFLSINVPTGIGKTLTVLNAALKLKNFRGDIDKIIYCLPFTSVIDQNAQVIDDILKTNGFKENSENLLVNHHLAELSYKTKTDIDEIDDNRSEYLITQFESNINVTTFYQLLHGIYTGKNNEIKKLHSFANSIIILDEVQSIPSKYWPLVKETFTQIAAKLNISFIFVTATLPMIFSEKEGEIKELVNNKESIFKAVDRISLDSTLLNEPIHEKEFLEIVDNDITANPDKSFLIILNTIKASKNIYKELRYRHSNLIYLSTNIPPIERLRRIKKIKDSEVPQIVVSTQLVEAGVDIDLDVVYRDLAPLDSIFQSAGRCNRNAGDNKGIVKIFSLLGDKGKRYSSYIYSHADLDTTRDLLKEKSSFRESDFFELGNKYFERVATTSNMDDSAFILKEIEKLNYANAFDPKVHDQAFELIEQLPTFPAYIVYEVEAKILLNQYFETIDKEFDSPFDKKREIKNILKKLSMYAVSVPEKYAFDDDRFYYVISDEQQDFSYDPDTGIEYESNEGVFI